MSEFIHYFMPKIWKSLYGECSSAFLISKEDNDNSTIINNST